MRAPSTTPYDVNRLPIIRFPEAVVPTTEVWIKVGLLLPTDLAARAIAKFDPSVVAIPTASLRELERVTVILSAGILLIDPVDCTRDDHAGGWLRADHPGWITIIFSPAEQKSAWSLLRALARRPRPLILADSGDVFDLQVIFARAREIESSAALLSLLRPHLERLPARIAIRIADLFAGFSPPNSLKALANSCKVAESTLRRHLRQVGILSGHRLVGASQVLRAWDLAVTGDIGLDKLAKRFGFGSRPTLLRQWLDVTGSRIPTNLGTGARLAPLRDIHRRLVTPDDAGPPSGIGDTDPLMSGFDR